MQRPRCQNRLGNAFYSKLSLYELLWRYTRQFRKKNFFKLDNTGTDAANITLKHLKLAQIWSMLPKTLRDLAVWYRNKKNISDKKEQNSDKSKNNSKFQTFLSSFLADVLIFTAVLIKLVITLIIIYVLYRQSKLKALVMNIAMQRIKAVEAADMNDMLCTCKTQWYIMGMLIIITFRHALPSY